MTTAGYVCVSALDDAALDVDTPFKDDPGYQVVWNLSLAFPPVARSIGWAKRLAATAGEWWNIDPVICAALVQRTDSLMDYVLAEHKPGSADEIFVRITQRVQVVMVEIMTDPKWTPPKSFLAQLPAPSGEYLRAWWRTWERRRVVWAAVPLPATEGTRGGGSNG